MIRLPLVTKYRISRDNAVPAGTGSGVRRPTRWDGLLADAVAVQRCAFLWRQNYLLTDGRSKK
jgi:hypothetical protein